MRFETSPRVLIELRDHLRERRQAQDAHRKLRRELAAYRTPSDIDDLLAAVDRAGDTPQAEVVRTILEHNLSDHHRRQRLAS